MAQDERTQLYFAYGSNLNPAQMAERCPGHRVVGRACLHGYTVRFRGYGRDWAGAVGTVEPFAGSDVWGVVFELTPAHYVTLDRYEGYDGPGEATNLYDRVEVAVEMESGGSVKCLTYVIRPLAEGLPSRAYLDAILTGARHHGLPAAYVAALEALPVAAAAGADVSRGP